MPTIELHTKFEKIRNQLYDIAMTKQVNVVGVYMSSLSIIFIHGGDSYRALAICNFLDGVLVGLEFRLMKNGRQIGLV